MSSRGLGVNAHALPAPELRSQDHIDAGIAAVCLCSACAVLVLGLCSAAMPDGPGAACASSACLSCISAEHLGVPAVRQVRKACKSARVTCQAMDWDSCLSSGIAGVNWWLLASRIGVLYLGCLLRKGLASDFAVKISVHVTDAAAGQYKLSKAAAAKLGCEGLPANVRWVTLIGAQLATRL